MANLAAALALLLTTAEPAPAMPAWLAGGWQTDVGERWTEEWWTPPRSGMMIGGGLSGRGDRATSFEHMRIAVADGRLTFYGMPGGTPAVPFSLARSSEHELVFENPAHDYPQRIVYRLEGNTLVATTSLIDGSQPQSWRYARIVTPRADR